MCFVIRKKLFTRSVRKKIAKHFFQVDFVDKLYFNEYAGRVDVIINSFSVENIEKLTDIYFYMLDNHIVPYFDYMANIYEDWCSGIKVTR
jgi:hypothetical protein